MSLDVLKYGEKALRIKGELVTDFDDAFRETVTAMKEVMLASDGVGLAAPQVGISKRFFVMGVPVDMKKRDGERTWYVIANPEFVSTTETEIVMEEGCLSFPGLFFEVSRPEAIVISYQDEFGEKKTLGADGYLARIIQHEYDHLDGKLYIDRISGFKRSLLRNKLRRLQVKD